MPRASAPSAAPASSSCDDSPTRSDLSRGHAGPRGLCGDAARPDPAEALRPGRVQAPATWDCVLVNLLSPRFDGVELCRQLNVYRGVAPAARHGRRRPSTSSASATRTAATCSHAAFAAGADDIVPGDGRSRRDAGAHPRARPPQAAAGRELAHRSGAAASGSSPWSGRGRKPRPPKRAPRWPARSNAPTTNSRRPTTC